MEFSQVFGFLLIFLQSIKILAKNGKFMAPITILSLLLPSILLLVFFYIHRFFINLMIKSIDYEYLYLQIIASLVLLLLLLVVEISFIIAFVLVSHASSIATILVSATSYSDKNTSARDLYSRIKATCRRKLAFRNYTFCGSNYGRGPNRLASIALTVLAVMLSQLAVFYQNLITISVAIVVIVVVSVYQMYHAVATVMSHIVSIVEEREREEVLERAEELVEGQKHHGFMINLFFNLLFLISFLGLWIKYKETFWFVDIMVYLLVWLNSLSLVRILGCVAYTVLYFQCKKFHGEEIHPMAGFEYNKLPTSNWG